MKNLSLAEEEQDLLKIFGALSERERIKVLEDSIRDEKDDSVRKVMQFFLSEFKSSS